MQCLPIRQSSPCRDYTAHQFGQAEPGKARDDLRASGVTQSPPSWWVPEPVRPGARRLAPCDTIDTGADVPAELPAIPKAGTLSTARASQRHAARGTTSGADSAARFLRRGNLARTPRPRAFAACVHTGVRLPEFVGLYRANAAWSFEPTLPHERGGV
jgi:hypothetical protein